MLPRFGALKFVMDTQPHIASSASSAIAPEDLSPGCYIAVLHVINEHMPFLCSEEFLRDRTEPVKIRWLGGAGMPPMKVIDVCLPFVLVRQPTGKVRTLDVRRLRLARLSDAYGRKAFRAFKAAEKEKTPKSEDSKSSNESKAGENKDDRKE
jgi:hypothetical protein